MEIPIVYPTKFNRCEIETIIVKTNIMRKEYHNFNVEAINSCEK